MPTSTVKWFDEKKGYGFIRHPRGGNDVFVHYSNIESDDEFKTLQDGQSVEFEMNDGPKGLHALNVVVTEEMRSESGQSDPNLEIGPADVDPTAEVNPLASDPSS